MSKYKISQSKEMCMSFSCFFSMCTWESTKDMTTEGSAERPRQPDMNYAILSTGGKKEPSKQVLKYIFREKIKSFKQ